MKPIIKGVLVALTFSSPTLAQQQTEANVAKTHAATGQLGWMYTDVAQATTQENISWEQHVKLGELIESMGDREAAVDKALADGIIDEEQAIRLYRQR